MTKESEEYKHHSMERINAYKNERGWVEVDDMLSDLVAALKIGGFSEQAVHARVADLWNRIIIRRGVGNA